VSQGSLIFSQTLANGARRVANWPLWLAKTNLGGSARRVLLDGAMTKRFDVLSPFGVFTATSLAFLLVGCSSASSSSAVDGGHDDARHVPSDARSDARADARTVCEPLALVDAGHADARADAGAPDAKADAARDASDDDAPIACTFDTHCPAGKVCDTKTTGEGAGTCVANDGKTLCAALPDDGGGAPGTCSVNTGDMCCTATAGCLAKPEAGVVGGGACCPGAAGNLYCQTQLSNDQATCGATGLCATCMDGCLLATPAAYQKFLGYQVTECGCAADGPCYDTCHTSTTFAAASACGQCLTAQTKEGLSSTCTLAAAVDCSNDPGCTAYQACAGMCPM
jgi:hypothetical protein